MVGSKLDEGEGDRVDSASDSHLDGVQGAGEQRTEDVQGGTLKEQPQPATPQSAKSGSRVTSFAGEQATAMQVTGDDIEEAIQYSKKYLEDLLSFFGLNTDIYATTEDHEVIELNVPSTHLNGFLIGLHGDTLRAMQYLISSALRSQNFAHTRVNVDIADYKRHHAERLLFRAEDWFKEVRDSGKEKELEPMTAAERRVVHQAATDYGLTTESTGQGRERHIVLKPAAGSDEPKNDDKEEESTEEENA